MENKKHETKEKKEKKEKDKKDKKPVVEQEDESTMIHPVFLNGYV